MRLPVLLLTSLLLLSSCSLFKPAESLPEYLREDSPLDPPGTAAARAEMRAKYLKEGIYAKGDRVDIFGGRIVLFDRNPERESNIKARSIETGTVKVIACEGTYYFVEADGGEMGYAKETDLFNPAAMPLLPEGQEPFGPLVPGDGQLIPGVPGADGAGVDIGGNQRLMQDADGHSVIITPSSSQRSSEFAARERALQQGQSLPASGEDEGSDELPPSSLDHH